MSRTEMIKGQVVSVRLLKGSWGRLEVQASSGDTKTTVMGTVLGVDVGTTIECRGRWDTHPQYGKQFKADQITTTTPSDSSGVIAWLCAKLPRIGRKRATDIVERFGVDGAWRALESTDGAALTEINGITPDAARAIATEYAAHRADRDEQVILRGWGLTDGQIARCREVWPEGLIEALKANPYELSRRVTGFGFKRSDEVARRMGIPVDYPSRLVAGLAYALEEAEGSGHCYLTSGALVREASELLGVDGGLVAAQLGAAEEEQLIVRDGTRIYLRATHAAEVRVAESVRRFLAIGRGKQEGIQQSTHAGEAA